MSSITPAYVVQTGSHTSEAFDPVKLHGSVLEACFSVRAFEGEAHAVAERVCKDVIDWIIDKTEVTSNDIRRIASEYLELYHSDAAYFYDQHNAIL